MSAATARSHRSTSAAATTPPRNASAPPVLGHNHRSRDPVYHDAAELFRDHQPAAAVEVLRAQDAVFDHHAAPVDAWVAMVNDWLTHRATGHSVLTLATERATVAELNRLARTHLVARGDITRRSRTYQAPDDHARSRSPSATRSSCAATTGSPNPTAPRSRCATA